MRLVPGAGVRRVGGRRGRGWGEYLNELLKGTIGVTIPAALSAPPGDGGVFNLPALIVVLLAMVFLMGGAKESARANTIMVCVKIAALVLFCAIGVQASARATTPTSCRWA